MDVKSREPMAATYSIALLDNNQGQNRQVGVHDAATHRLPLALTSATWTVA